jgi:hypothetical protein
MSVERQDFRELPSATFAPVRTAKLSPVPDDAAPAHPTANPDQDQEARHGAGRRIFPQACVRELAEA